MWIRLFGDRLFVETVEQLARDAPVEPFEKLFVEVAALLFGGGGRGPVGGNQSILRSQGENDERKRGKKAYVSEHCMDSETRGQPGESFPNRRFLHYTPFFPTEHDVFQAIPKRGSD